MKVFKIVLLNLALIFGVSSVLFAQWTVNSSTNQVYLNGTAYPYSVGVGAGANNTQSILSKFHVVNEALFSATGMTTGPSLGAGNLSIAGSASGLSLWNRSLTSLSDSNSVGNRWLWYNLSGNLRLRTGTTGEVIAVLSNGNMGVGVYSPAYKLHVNGDLKLNNNLYFANAFNLVDSATGTFGMKSSTTSGLQFLSKNSTARMSIDTNGNVSVGGGNLSLASSGNLTLSSGKIGVGKSNPGTPIDIVSSSSGAIRLLSGADTLSTSIALGRTASDAYLGITGVNGTLSTQSTKGDLVLQNYNEDIIIAARNSIGAIRFTTGWSTDTARVTIAHNGNVGIGTTTPDTFKLAVKGLIKAKEVLVDTTGWADYVFTDSYDLKSLDEVEATIKSEKHLPGIPTAAEVGKSGIHLSQMQSKLLQKIEELTLYVIQLKKENDALKERTESIIRQNKPLR